MAYFARNNNKSPPRARGRGHNVRETEPESTHATRDQIIEDNIRRMQQGAAGDGTGFKFVSDSKAPVTGKAGIGASRGTRSEIFGGPLEAKQPTPRMRVGVSDDELRKIWHEDDKKQQAAARMECAPTMVEKMVNAPPIPGVPCTAKKEEQYSRRHRVDLSDTTAEKRREAFEPAGFRGIGQNCKPEGRRGRHCAPVQDFQPPDLVVKPRQTGRRTVFPKDTFSFNDGHQEQQQIQPEQQQYA